MNKVRLTAISVTLAFSLAGCGTKPAPAPSAPAPAAPPATGTTGGAKAGAGGGAAAADGQAIYKTNCLSCHGADMSGGVGPSLQKVGSRMNADQIASRIGAGGGGMPPFKGTLTDPQIAALADWLASNK